MRPDKTFQNYNPETRSQEEACSTIQTYAQAISQRLQEGKSTNDSPRLVLLHGKSGTGKSHLMEALYKHLQETAGRMRRETPAFFMEKTLEHQFPVVSPVYIENKKILIIDDLFQNHDCGQVAHHILETLWKLIVLGYQENMLIFIATNHDPEVFLNATIQREKHGRLESRLAEMTRLGKNILHVEGPDGRQKNSTSENLL